MRNAAIFFTAILIMGVGFQGTTAAPTGENWEINYYGKVVGWILDPETGKPATDKFRLRFYFLHPDDGKMTKIVYEVDSDNNGHFIRKLFPGRYLVQIGPFTNRKYCHEPTVKKFPDKAYKLEIKKDQITKMYKNAAIGGNLRVFLVGPDGHRLNVEEIFKDAKVTVSISNKETGMRPFIRMRDNPSEDKSEFLFENFAPGKYTVKLNCIFSDIVNQKIDDIIIEKKETTEFRLVIDLNTVLEGIVRDIHGVPVKSVHIEMRGNDDEGFYESTMTDVSGYYRFQGLNEGSYNVDFYIENDNIEFFGGEIKEIIVIKNETNKRDIVFKMIRVE